MRHFYYKGFTIYFRFGDESVLILGLIEPKAFNSLKECKEFINNFRPKVRK